MLKISEISLEHDRNKKKNTKFTIGIFNLKVFDDMIVYIWSKFQKFQKNSILADIVMVVIIFLYRIHNIGNPLLTTRKDYLKRKL